jgi:hypothetical protein
MILGFSQNVPVWAEPHRYCRPGVHHCPDSGTTT